jgi:tartrate dehydratase alpha subunit/fumarate hydratase class I-like protein
VKKYNVFQMGQSTGIATFSLRVAEELNEATQQSIKERITRALTEWTSDVKWEIFVEFTR